MIALTFVYISYENQSRLLALLYITCLHASLNSSFTVIIVLDKVVQAILA